MSDGLHRRKSVWYFRIPIGLSRDGRAHEESTRTDSYAEAKDIRNRRMEELKRAESLPQEMGDWTIRYAVEDWIRHREAKGKARKTLALNRTLAKPLVASLGGVKLRELGIGHLRRYQSERREKVKGRTVNLELMPLIQSLQMAGLWDRLKANYEPFDREKSKIGRALQPEEEARLVSIARSKPEWLAVSLAIDLALSTGMRGWEIKSLQLEDIELERARIFVRRHKTKTDAGERIIPLNWPAVQVVAAILERAEQLGAAKLEDYAFPAELSRHTSELDPLHGRCGFDPHHHQQTFRTAWQSLCAEAGFCERNAAGEVTKITLRFHDLRHTFATKLARSGVPLAIAKGIMGHIGEEETEYYTHILGDDEVARNAVALLEKLPVRGEGLEEKKVSVQ